MSRSYFEAALDPETISAGTALPPLEKAPTRVGVVLFCSAIRNFHRLHYDETYTQAQGIKQILVPGFQMGNWCVEVATRALPAGAQVRRLKFKNTRMAFVGDQFTIVGTFAEVTPGPMTVARCEVRVLDGAGEVVTVGTVDVAWPA